jgi:hypothetical protein
LDVDSKLNLWKVDSGPGSTFVLLF